MLACSLLAVAVSPSDSVFGGLVGLVEKSGVFVVLLGVFVIVSVIEVAGIVVVAVVAGLVVVVEGAIVVGFTSVRLQQTKLHIKAIHNGKGAFGLIELLGITSDFAKIPSTEN